MRELIRSLVSFSWALPLFGLRQMANLVSQRPAPGTPGPAPRAGSPDLLTQVGGLAFDLLQWGVNAVYQLSGAAWQQQQGLSGWGPIPPPPDATDTRK